MGKKAREIVENSRKSLQSMVSDTESQIIFTSGATEANHLAIRGIIYNYIEKGSLFVYSLFLILKRREISGTCCDEQCGTSEC